jgi:integrase
VWRSLKTDNLAEAKRRAHLLQDHLETVPQLEPASARTVRSFYEEWMFDYVTQECSTARAYNIRTGMAKHVLVDLGPLPLADINVRRLRRLRGSLEEKGLAKSTTSSILSIFRTMLSYAVTVGELERNPFTGAKIIPGEDDLAPRRLDEAQIETILEACPEEHRFTVELALATGLRWSELMRLTWAQAIWEPKPNLHVQGTKGRRKQKNRRLVPLDPEITQRLREARLRATSLLVIENQPGNSWVIRRRIRAKTGIQFRFHDLRHHADFRIMPLWWTTGLQGRGIRSRRRPRCRHNQRASRKVRSRSSGRKRGVLTPTGSVRARAFSLMLMSAWR